MARMPVTILERPYLYQTMVDPSPSEQTQTMTMEIVLANAASFQITMMKQNGFKKDGLKGEYSGDKFGRSVSMAKHGDVVAIGAYLNDNNGMNSGSVAIFSYRKDVTAWQPLGTAINGDCISEFLGRSVSLSDDGQVVAVGAPRGCYISNVLAGHTRIYAYNSSLLDWVQMGEDIAEEANYDRSGTSVSLSADGKIVAIGASSNDGNGNNSGHGRMFKYDGSAWSQIGDDIDGKSAWDLFGQSVSLLGDGLTVAFGASGGDYSGRVLIYKYAPA